MQVEVANDDLDTAVRVPSWNYYMLIAFSLLAFAAWLVISYFIVTKLLIPAKLLWIKIFDALVIAGLGAGVITALVKSIGG